MDKERIDRIIAEGLIKVGIATSVKVKPGSYIAVGYCEEQNGPAKPEAKLVAISDLDELKVKVARLFAECADIDSLIEDGEILPDEPIRISVQSGDIYGDTVAIGMGIGITFYLTRVTGAI